MTETASTASAPPEDPVVRVLRPVLSTVLTVGAVAWSADLYRSVGIVFLAEQLMAAALGVGLALVFLIYPLRRDRGRRGGVLPWYDVVLGVVGLATGIYVAIKYPTLVEHQFEQPLDGTIASMILYVLCVEALRRTAGYALVSIVLVFTAYALVGHLIPGAFQSRKMELDRLILYLGVDTSGLFGLVMMVAITVVLPFLIFGQLLLYSGGATFFNELSLALMGRYRGGAAKIAVMASGLFGSISGIVVSNIMATGVITIPMMKKSGFAPRHAAAIEATASTGGQLMPPVMGAVAFLMADFLQRPYSDIAIAALVPSILYYVAIFIQADLEAAKLGIKRVPEAEIPRLGEVLSKGWYFIIPFAVLVYALFWANLEAEMAALYASAAVLAVGFFFGYRGERIKPRQLFDVLVTTGTSSLEILMISAGAGFIMGILQVTGLGFALTLFLVKLGAGNLIALLVIAAIMCIVLGMGMPTLGVYVLLAILIAPSLVEAGITPLAAHMFILYLGMMSMITPPVAIAAFFAASLAGSEPMRTGFVAMRFGWTAYIVPFLFVFSPSLLLQSSSVVETGMAVITAIAGVWLISAGMIGFFMRPMSIAMRVGFVVAGTALIIPDGIARWAAWTDYFGAGLGALLVALEYMGAKRERLMPITANGRQPSI